MRILVITYFYHPDITAGAFRMQGLVDSLSEDYPDAEVEVVTTLPSRHPTYNPEICDVKVPSNVKITRLDVPQFVGGMKGEILSSVFFFLAARKYTKNKRYGVVVATSAKLMTACLGRYVARRSNAKLYLDIRDIFVENFKDFFSKPVRLLLLPLLEFLERYAIRGADRICVVSEGFRRRVFEISRGQCPINVITNGVDDTFSNLHQCAATTDKSSRSSKIRLLYAGTIGRAQMLERIIPDMAMRLGDGYEIHVIGGGRRALKLTDSLKKNNIRNVIVDAPVAREHLVDYYRKADVLLLHLDSCGSLSKVIPSKIFEYAATGKPILCGVSGFTAEFISQNVKNVGVFQPNNVDDAVTQLSNLDLGCCDRQDFVSKYSRAVLSQAMAKDVIASLVDAN